MTDRHTCFKIQRYAYLGTFCLAEVDESNTWDKKYGKTVGLAASEDFFGGVGFVSGDGGECLAPDIFCLITLLV